MESAGQAEVRDGGLGAVGWDGIRGLLSRPQHGLDMVRERDEGPNGDQREAEGVRGVTGRSVDVGRGATHSAMVTIRQEENEMAVLAQREHPINGQCSTTEWMRWVSDGDCTR